MIINIPKIRENPIPWKKDVWENQGNLINIEHKHQSTIPKDSEILNKLGINPEEEVLYIAGFYADWEKHL